MEAPRSIPEHMKEFTLNGKIPVYDQYINEVVSNNSIIWTNTYLQSFIDSVLIILYIKFLMMNSVNHIKNMKMEFIQIKINS